MAAKPDWSAPEFNGYAFLCFEQEGAAGGSDDCYAFYRGEQRKGLVGGRGTTRATFHRTPTRFPHPSATVSRGISDGQRLAALKIVDAWDEREYDLTPTSVLMLAYDLAQAMGFALPPRQNESPEKFLKRLQAFNP